MTQGRAHEDIAGESGCAPGTVRSTLSRVRSRVHEILDGEQQDETMPIAA